MHGNICQQDCSVSPAPHPIYPVASVHFAWMFSEPIRTCLPHLESILSRPLLLLPPPHQNPPAPLFIVDTSTTDAIPPCGQSLSLQISWTFSFTSRPLSPQVIGVLPAMLRWSCPSLPSAPRPRQALLPAIMGFQVGFRSARAHEGPRR